jgi:NAD(P)-dependent dehydrogenase (short-subunit alcohol dehydrogenase family)
MEMQGKVALITGAGSGIGKSAAIRLAREGAHVALLGRHPHELIPVASEIEASGGHALILNADVADEMQMRAAFEEAGEIFGRLDFVFANAGINGTWAPVEELSYADWNATQSINLGGTFLTVHFAVPLMKQHGGSIAITSSINGTRTFTTAGASAYSASKAGQLAFGKMMALELARYRIRVNVICPGGVMTNIGQNTKRVNTDSIKVAAEYPDGTIPLTGGQRAAPEDVADLVFFLASDRSRHISGTPIWIDGAQSLLI